jgi:hypothetical protein
LGHVTMSVRVAAPVAKQGLPKNPWRNRRARNPGKFAHRAAATVSRMKTMNVMM